MARETNVYWGGVDGKDLSTSKACHRDRANTLSIPRKQNMNDVSVYQPTYPS